MLKRHASRFLAVLVVCAVGGGCVPVQEVRVVPLCDYLWARFNDPQLDDPIERWRIYEAMELSHCTR